MQLSINGAILALTIIGTSCSNSKQQIAKEMEQHEGKTVILPTAEKWVSSPVRNRLILELNKPVSEVYALVGDPANMPNYSSGLDSVTTKMENGKCASYTCYFKPAKEGEPGYVHTDKMVWQQLNQGWASRTPEPNEFGFTQYVSLTTLEEKDGKTILTWYMHYNHEKEEMIDMNKTGLDQAFQDIGNQLVNRFGGKIVENFVEGKAAD